MTRAAQATSYGVLAASLGWIAWLPRLGLSASHYLIGVTLAAVAFLCLLRSGGRGAPHGPVSAAGERPHGVLFRSRGLWLGALGLRLLVLGAPPYLSDDVGRYFWEGRVQRAGFSPYVHAPDAEVLAPLRDEVRWPVNHPHVPAAYPPGIQLVFRLLPASLVVWKLVLLAADLALLGLLLQWLRRRGRPDAAAAWYAYHPLIVLEFAASAHLDLLAMLPLVAALLWWKRSWWVAALAAAAALVKPPGLAAAAPLLQRRALGACALCLGLLVLGFLPFARDGAALFEGLRTYEEHWEFNGLVHAPLREALTAGKRALERLDPAQGWTAPWREIGYWLQPNHHARRLAGAVFLALAAWVLVRTRTPEHAVLGLLLAYLATSPTVFPWYVAWVVPLGVLVRSPAVATLTLVALVPGVVKVTELVTGVWSEPGWVRCVHWVPVCLIGAVELWRRRGPPAARPSRAV